MNKERMITDAIADAVEGVKPNISVVSGFELKTKESEKLKSEVDAWLKKKGNKVKKIEGFVQVAEKKIRVDKTTKKRNKEVRVISAILIAKQKAILDEYVSFYKSIYYDKYYWKIITEATGVTNSRLYNVVTEASSINKEDFAKVEKFIGEFYAKNKKD